MNIAEDTKLDFSDVLIRPKRSTLRSRKEVNLDREFEFVHSGWVWEGVPIMAANMDTSGTFEMHKALTKHSMITAIHKHYTLEDWKKNLNGLAWAYLAVSIGANEQDFEKLIGIASMGPLMRFICIDVANGYGEYLPEFVRRVRERFPKVTIIAGNVVTGDMTEQLILSGADIVKVGIGSGCFTPGTQVKTQDGNKNIEDVKGGDIVITHMGNWQKVTNTFKYQENEKVVSVNGIKSTARHKYYVVEKQYKDILTDNNIHEYAKWVKAEDLDKDKYFLLKHN